MAQISSLLSLMLGHCMSASPLGPSTLGKADVEMQLVGGTTFGIWQ